MQPGGFTPEETEALKCAIDAGDLTSVQTLMTRNPALHRAPLGYNGNGPLTLVAECRVPPRPPGPARLAIAQWMIENGSDVHQGGDGPLMRAALSGMRVPMMELLVARGADVNATWNGHYPILFAPCETVEPAPLRWLLEHGANPNCVNPKQPESGTALDQLIGGYLRSPRLAECIDILLAAGGVTKYAQTPLLDLLRGRLDQFADQLDADPSLIQRRFPEFDFGATAARRLTLRGATLLHVAAEYGGVEAATLLLDRSAGVDARAAGGQSPIFHAATQFNDAGLAVARLLIERGADLSLKAKLPGHYERPGEFVECTPLEYAGLFPGGESETVALLRSR